MSNFTPLSHSDFLHRSAKLKCFYVASSVLYLHMKVHEAGIDLVFNDGTVIRSTCCRCRLNLLFLASKYDFDFCKTVVTKCLVICSVSQFVSASSFGC